MAIEGPSVPLATGSSPGYSAPGVVGFDGNAGEQVARMGGALASLGQAAVRIQEENDISTAKRADAEIAEEIRKASYDDNGYLNQIGADAVDGRRAAQERLERSVRSVSETVKSAGARSRLGPMMRQRLSEAAAQFDRHYAVQSRSHALGAAQARLKALASDYVDAVSDPDGQERAAVAFGAALRETAEIGALSGYGGDEQKGLERDVTSGLHGSAIRMFLATNQPTAARDYLDDVRDELTSEIREDLEGRVRRGVVDEEAARIADELEAAGGTTLEKMARAVARHQNGEFGVEVRDGIQDRLRQNDAIRRTQIAADRSDAYDNAIEWLQQNRAPYSLMPNELREAVERSGVRGKIDRFIRDGGLRRNTDDGMSILLALRADNRSLRGKPWPVVYDALNDQLDDGKLAMIADFWADANKATRPQNVMPSSRVGAVVLQAMQDAELLPTDRTVTPEERMRHERIEFEVETQVRDFPGGIQNTPQGDEQLRTIIEKVLRTTLTTPSGKKLPASALTPTEKAGSFVETSTGEMITKQELEDAGSVEHRLAMQNLQQKNMAIAAQNAAREPGSPEKLMIPVLPETIAEEIAQVRLERRGAREQALRWLKSGRTPAAGWRTTEIPQDKGWDGLPDNIRDRLQRLLIEDEVRAAWEQWSMTHDFMGRRIRGSGEMTRTFESPWRR